MPEKKAHDLKEFQMRARLPQLFRYGAVAVIVVTVLAVIVGFYRGRSASGFRLKSEHTQLSTDVVASVTGYDRLESDGEKPKYYIKAENARTFADDHQELDGVYIEIYGDDGATADTMTARQVLYVPEADKNFTAYMKGDVNIETRDRLKVRTPNIVYTKANETAEADERVEFERDNIRGTAFGASVNIAEKRLELSKDVEIETFESPELVRSGVRYSKINAVTASFDQLNNKIDLNENVRIVIDSMSRSTGNAVRTDIAADRASVLFQGDGEARTDASTPSAHLKRFELFDNVRINSTETGAAPTNIDSGYALFDKAADRYELKDRAHIVTDVAEKPTDIRANEIVYDQGALKIVLSGLAEITHGAEYLRGKTIDADLFADKKLKYAVVRGEALVKQTTAARTMTVAAPELNAVFGESRQLQVANAIGQSTATVVPNGDSDFSSLTMTSPRAMRVSFKGEGLLEQMTTQGRTTIQLNAINNGADAANKRVTADEVKTIFNDDGKDIRRAEAVGNAELYIEPLRLSADNYRTTISAPRFDCEFFAGNNAKSCIGGKKARAVRVPSVQAEGRGTQTLVADSLDAGFSEATKDIDALTATGNAKFTQLDRSAIAAQMNYTQADRMVRFRGGEPTAWDSRSRVRAREIDWDTANRRSYMRGGVSTTYYSRKTMGDSLPFSSSEKPVFVTSDTAEFDHAAETAAFSGNARGWQDDNYVRGDRIIVKQKEGRFSAEGSVQSVIYNVKQKQKGRDTSVPVYASSELMNYDRATRLIQYRESVDIRQGTDRITSGSADVYLNEQNELSRTIAESSVVITQPGRRATGTRVEYSAADEIAVLRGSPATIADSVNGTTQAAELTFKMRENSVISEGKTKTNGTGRIRSVYKVNPNQ